VCEENVDDDAERRQNVTQPGQATELIAAFRAGKLTRRQLFRRAAMAGIGASAVTALLAQGPDKAAAAPGGTLRRSSSRAADTTEISFWKPPHSDKEADIWQPLLDEFMQQHPEIKVTHTVVPWANVDEQFTAAFAGGDPPDVFYLPDEWYPKYVKQEQIADISSVFGDLEANYDESVWSIGSYKGKLYGVPFLGVIHALLLNMDLLEAGGFAAPKSWDEIETIAKALTNTDQGIYGLWMPSDPGWTFLKPLLAVGGTKVLSDDLTKVVADTDGGIAAWDQALRKISYDDKATAPLGLTPDQVTDLSIKGKFAMMWSEESTIKPVWRTQAPNTKLDVVPLPPLPGFGQNPAVWTNVGFMFMAEHSKHKDQAEQLIRFLADKHVQEEYVVKGVDLMSPMKGVVVENPDPIVAKYLSFLPYGVGTEMSVHWVDATQSLDQEAQAVRTGQKSAKDALKSVKDTVEGVLDGE
jgi:multiple sugar transport system substrate-binding protein